MRTLQEIYENHKSPEGHGDKGTAHTYIDEYAVLLDKYRNGSTLLEIGVSHGESMEMWSDYFEDSNLYGVDITTMYFKSGLQDDTRFNIIIGDATKESILEQLPEGLTFDIIIDDGSHDVKDQINTFNVFKKRMNPGGIFIIEDVVKLDTNREKFYLLHHNCEVIDNRRKKDRHDDVLIVYRF